MSRNDPEPKAAAQRKPWLRWLLLLVLILAAASFLDLKRLFAELNKVSLLAIALCVGAEMLFYALECVRIWALSNRYYGFNALWRSRLTSVLVGNFLPGSGGGDVLRIFLLDSVKPGRKFYTLLLVVTSRVYGLLAMGAILPVALYFVRESLPVRVAINFPVAMLGCLIVASAPLIFVQRSSRRILVRGVHRFHGSWRSLARTLYLGTVTFARPRQWLVAITTSIATNLLVFLEFWVIGRSLDIDFGFSMWAFIVPLIAIASFLPIGFGPIGPQDASLVGVAKLFGKPPEVFLALSLCIHAIRILGMAAGTFYLDDLRRLVPEKSAVHRMLDRFSWKR